MPVYLIHFDKPYKHARHYLGWTDNLETRLNEHINGNGSRLLQVISAADITWTLARVWTNAPRGFEMHLKRNHKDSKSLCPQCCNTAMDHMNFEHAADFPTFDWSRRGY
jgi:predicted GIY-YIG superfamily endonuclease